jgi:large subunit ribosomal protein L3
MPTRKSPRKGSLQFWPRKRASKFLPRVNWNVISGSKGLKGIICYKAGMSSAYVKDLTPTSMTKNKKISLPVTLFECPPIKIFSIRFYKNNKVICEVLAENPDKELIRALKLPKKKGKKLEEVKDYDDIRVICYSIVKKTNIKKKPDLAEIGLSGSIEEKLAFIKEHLNKEITISEIFENGQLIDFRGLTKGQGFSGPVKRFGIHLKQHKSEKGVRRPGSIGPWHPAHVSFRVPMAGQLGMFTRVAYNNKIIDMGKSEGKFKNIKNFGDIKTDYLMVAGSIQGPTKRQLLITSSLKESKKQKKGQFEFIGLAK